MEYSAGIFKSIGISRLRMSTDGKGVTTLVGGYGCPLDCRYCLNPMCHTKAKKSYTEAELFDTVKSDSLYFEATGGGITFGGGEPLLQADFIREFIGYVRNSGRSWRFTVETSLAVEWTNVDKIADLADDFIIDLKDSDESIYRAYTGQSGEPARENLKRLAAVCPEKLRVRLPMIPGFNTEADVVRSEAFVRSLGIFNAERFTYTII